MTPSESAAPALAAERQRSEEVQALLLDIFALTGQKVQKDDPLVAAALIHSALLRRAGEDAARAIKAAAAPPAPEKPQERQAPSATRAWRSRLLLGSVLFLLCLGAGALGSYLTVMNFDAMQSPNCRNVNN